MDIQELEQKIKQANEKYVSGNDAGGAQAPTDVYKRNAKAITVERKKKRPNGSAPIVRAVTKSVVDGDGVRGAGLAPAYKRARDDSDFFKEREEYDRADIVRNQYMEEHFLPAVEAVIAYSSPDEVLNCKEALDTFDKYVLGTGRAKGYTAQYIRSAYGNALGEDYSGRTGRSDDFVRNAVQRIKELAYHGQNRDAVSIAISVKKQIDEGSHIAEDEDYSVIGRVAAYGG